MPEPGNGPEMFEKESHWLNLSRVRDFDRVWDGVAWLSWFDEMEFETFAGAIGLWLGNVQILNIQASLNIFRMNGNWSNHDLNIAKSMRLSSGFTCDPD